MSVHNNDQRLTAYALGEMSNAEAEAFSLEMQSDIELISEESEIRELADMLADGFGTPENSGLTSSQRAAIFDSSRDCDDERVIINVRRARWRSHMIAISSAAAVLCATVWLLKDYGDMNTQNLVQGVKWSEIEDAEVLVRFSENSSDWDQLAVTSKELSSANHHVTAAITAEPDNFKRESIARAGEAGYLDSKELSHLEASEGWKTVKGRDLVRMPMICGQGSWKLISNAVSSQRIPLVSEIRTEEVINAVEYDTPTDVMIDGLNAGLEIVYCPWNPENVVVSILLECSSAQRGLQAAVSFGSAVNSYRLIGYSEVTNTTLESPAALDTPEGYSHMVLYELKLSETDLGGAPVINLHLKSMTERFEETAIVSSFANKSWEQAGGNTRLALCLAAWATEMKHESSTMKVTREVLEKLPFEILTGSAREALSVIQSCLVLKDLRINR